jgi:hypothetical protein
MKCAFCGHKTGKEASHYTTERDYVCRDCAINFELGMQFGDDYELYLNSEADAELLAKVEEQKLFWQAHFAEKAMSYMIPDELEPLDSSWTELMIETMEGDYRIEILASAYDGIRYFWKLIDKHKPNEYLAMDRLFESQGQALDDALQFQEELILSNSAGEAKHE